jgi:hypothetical protein
VFEEFYLGASRLSIENNAKAETKFPQLNVMQETWGKNYQVLTLDLKGPFNLTDGDQIYVMGGHGNPGSGVVFWGDEKNEKNWLPAETVAEYATERFPSLYRPRSVTNNIGTNLKGSDTWYHSQGLFLSQR